MNKRFLIIILVLAVLVGGFLLLPNNNSDTTNGSSVTMKSTASTTSHFEGDLSSKVTLTEYGDFQCPVCGGYFPITQQVYQKYKDTVKFQFRNLPLSQIHKNAFAGARAAEAADLQGKYWQMHDLLYQNQDTSGQSGWVVSDDPLNQYFVGYAKQLGLNETQFKSDFASSKVNDRINADTASYNNPAGPSTPTFFINGTYVANTKLVDSSGAPSVDTFSNQLDAALKAAK